MATEMADDKKTSQDNRIRKLRKKLRQIENLQRLSGYRELTEEESLKVEQRDNIREQLQELLSMVQSVEKKNVDDDGAHISNDQGNDFEKHDQKLIQDEVKIESDEMAEGEEKMKLNEQIVKEPEEENEMSSELLKEEQIPPRNEKVEASEKVTNNIVNEKRKEQLERNVKKKLNNGAKEWKNMQFAVQMIEGHHHPVCAVDSNKEVIVSGGHDTSLKVWNADTYEEMFSLGGHTGSISSLRLISDETVITGSQDCSVKIWNVKQGALVKSVYVYNPVTCLSYRDNKIAIGKEGGKIDIFDKDTEQVTFSIKAHEEDVVCLEFMDGNRLASASADGIIKVFEIADRSYTQVMDSYDDITGISSLKKDNAEADTPNTSLQGLPLRKINCMSTFKDIVFWGDDGYNIKALDIKTGHVVKLLNNLSEFSSTDSLAALSKGDSGWLFSAGFDIDNGNGYINVRSLPSMDYIGTIADSTLGHVSCILPSWNDGKIRIVTGGSELRIWEQKNAVNSKKRPASDQIEDVIPCKFNCSYNNFQDSESENESLSSDSEEVEKLSAQEPEKKSWCVLQ